MHARIASRRAWRVSKSGEIQALRRRRAFRRRRLLAVSRAPACSRASRSSTSPAVHTGTSTTGRGDHGLFQQAANVPVSRCRPPHRQRRRASTGGRAAAGDRLDPIEMRRRNIMPDDGYPAVTAAGHQAQGPVAPALHRRSGRAHGLRGAAKGAGQLREERASIAASALRASSRGRRPGRVAITAIGGAPIACRTPASSGSSRRAASVLGGRDRAGPGHRHRDGPDRGAALGVPIEERAGDLRRHRCTALRRRHLCGPRAAAIGGEAVYPGRARSAVGDLRNRRNAAAGRTLGARYRRWTRGRSRQRGARRLPLAEIGRDRAFPARRAARAACSPCCRHTRRFHLARRSLHLHQRHSRRLCRGGHRHRLRAAPQALGGGGLRPRHQPAAGRRAGARRLRAGPRRRALRALHL